MCFYSVPALQKLRLLPVHDSSSLEAKRSSAEENVLRFGMRSKGLLLHEVRAATQREYIQSAED